jgi:hypothetical protein
MTALARLAKNRWAWAGAFWLAAIAIVFWNHQKIDLILSIEEQIQSLNHELVFQQQYGRRLEGLLQEYAALSLPVESVQLGVLSAQNALRELAGALELAPPQFTVAPIVKGDETAALNVSVEGPFETITLFLLGITRLRYLEEKQSTIKIDPKRNEARCDLSMALRCRLQGGSETLPGRGTKARSAL